MENRRFVIIKHFLHEPKGHTFQEIFVSFTDDANIQCLIIPRRNFNLNCNNGGFF